MSIFYNINELYLFSYSIFWLIFSFSIIGTIFQTSKIKFFKIIKMKDLTHAILTQLRIRSFHLNLELMLCFQMSAFPRHTEKHFDLLCWSSFNKSWVLFSLSHSMKTRKANALVKPNLFLFVMWSKGSV